MLLLAYFVGEFSMLLETFRNHLYEDVKEVIDFILKYWIMLNDLESCFRC